MEFEPLDDFEEKLKRSFERWPAPPELKRRLMENRRRRKERRLPKAGGEDFGRAEGSRLHRLRCDFWL